MTVNPNPGSINHATVNRSESRLSGLDRSSCSWRDALGPGYAAGVKPSVLSMVASAANRGYCA